MLEPARFETRPRPEKSVVLLVEDDPTTAELMAELLRELDLVVHQANHPDQAVERAADLRPDLIVTDLQLSGGVRPAWESAERLRAATGAPILVATGRQGAREEGDRRGFAVLVKPFDLEEFEDAVRALLDPG